MSAVQDLLNSGRKPKTVHFTCAVKRCIAIVRVSRLCCCGGVSEKYDAEIIAREYCRRSPPRDPILASSTRTTRPARP